MATIHMNVSFVTETCCDKQCGITWAITREFYNQVRSNGRWFYCPNGHSQHYPQGKTDEQKLHDAEARETALKDQLRAANRTAEFTRVALLRDRQRFANGVCPCCNRSFENVRRHMSTKHPDYDPTKVEQKFTVRCSCGRGFDTVRGLQAHQRYQRGTTWDAPGTSSYAAHLTRV